MPDAAVADDVARHLRASCDQITAMLERQRLADEEVAIAAVKRRFGTPVAGERAGSSCDEALNISAIEAGVEQSLLARELSDAERRIERLAAQLALTQHQLATALAREDGLRRSLEEILGQHLTGSRPCANGLLMAWANTLPLAPHSCGKPPADPPQPLSAHSESEERGGGSPIPEGASTPTWLRRAAALIPECDLGVTPGAPPAQTAPAAASQTPLTADSTIASATTCAATRTVEATATSPYKAGGAPSGWSSPLEQQPQVAAPIERPRAAREAAARMATAVAVAAARVPQSLDPPGALPPPALATTQAERVPPDLARASLGGSASCSSAGRGSHGATPLDNGVRTAGTATATGATWHVTTPSPTRMATRARSPPPAAQLPPPPPAAQLPPPPPAAQLPSAAAQAPPSPPRRDGSGPVRTTLSPSTNARHQIERARRTIDGWQATAADFLKVSHHSQASGSKEIGPPITFY